MLKLIFLVLIPIVLSQSTTDSCSRRPCRPDQFCINRKSGNFLCLDNSQLQSLVSSLPIQQQQQTQGRLSVLPTTDRVPVPVRKPVKQVLTPPSTGQVLMPTMPVVLPTEMPTISNTRLVDAPSTDVLRRGSFISTRTRPVVKPVDDAIMRSFGNLPFVPRLGDAAEPFQRAFAQSQMFDEEIETTTALAPTTTELPFSIREICRGINSGDKVAHPFDNSKFIICNPPSGGTVLGCPPTLRFNTFRGRCDYTDAQPTPACLSNPCKNGGQCVDTQNYDFQCMCPEGFEGARCDKGVDPCSTNPCGPRGVCKTFGFISFNVKYHCLCDNGQRYGLDCGPNASLNPCMSNAEESYFPVDFSQSVFIHCVDNQIHFQACNPPLVWSQEIHGCDRLSF